MRLFFFLLLTSVTACSPRSITPPFTAAAPPTLTPLPGFLGLVRPTEPVSVAEYEASLEAPDYSRRGIVVAIVSQAEDGTAGRDNAVAVLDRLSIAVDGRVLPHNLSVAQDGLMPFGPFIFSWSPRLMSGVHEVQIRYRDRDGKAWEYVWSFVLTEGH